MSSCWSPLVRAGQRLIDRTCTKFFSITATSKEAKGAGHFDSRISALVKAMSSAYERNCGPILETLRPYLKDTGSRDGPTVLEVASGVGLHARHFALNLPHVIWQPTEGDGQLLEEISRRTADVRDRVREPVHLDVSKPVLNVFDAESFDAVLAINLTHISPSKTTGGLFRAASHVLKNGGRLIVYGPFAVDGVISPESNVRFDAYLKGRNSSWGLRDVTDLNLLGASFGFSEAVRHSMPANNMTLVWQKTGPPPSEPTTQPPAMYLAG